MKGDFTRYPDARDGRYDRVLLQQGRVQLDSDWNEQVETAARRERAALSDLVGAHGAPSGSRGFELTVWHGARLAAGDRFRAPGLAFPDRSPFTIEAWVHLDALGHAGTILSTQHEADPLGYELCFDAHGRLLFRRAEVEAREVVRPEVEEFTFGEIEVVVRREVESEDRRVVDRVLRAHEPLRTGGHVQVVATFDGEALSLYADGRLVAHRADSGLAADSNGDLRLGGFAGTLGRTRAWPLALSERGVRLLRSRTQGAPDGPLVDYRFEETSGRALADRSGRGRDAACEGGELEWRHEIWIGEGRYYVAGRACESRRDAPLDAQDALPGFVAPESGLHLAYLDVWERHVTCLEDPSLREVALPGDTATRVETVAQVRLLPVAGGGRTDRAEGFAEWRRFLARSGSHGRMRARRALYDANVDNLLYRVEVHGGGVPRTPRGEAGTVAVEAWELASRRLRLRAWGSDGLPWTRGDAIEAWDLSPGGAPTPRPAARVVEVDAAARTLVLDATAEGWGEDAPHAIRRVPTFKWSRLNGARVYPVASVDDQGWVALATGMGERVAIREGDWVELATRASDLAGGGAPLYPVVDVNEASRLVRLGGAPPVPRERAFLRCWDQADAAVLAATGTLAAHAGGWIPLEDGIEVEFDGSGLHQPGDFWTFTVRKALGGVAWPQEDGGPAFRPPEGGAHAYAPLALVEYGPQGPTIHAVYRRSFTPLVDVAREEGEFVRRSGDTMTGPLRVQGAIHADGELHARTLHGALPPGAVGTEQLRDFSVTEPKLGYATRDESSGCVLRESAAPFEGHRATGAQVVVPYPAPPPPPAGGPVLRAVAMGQAVLALDGVRAWLLHPHEGRIVECPPMPAPLADYALAASPEESYVVGRGTTFAYRKADEAWRELPPVPGRLAVGRAAAFRDGRLYVAGGESRLLRFWRRVEARFLKLDPFGGDWRELAPLPKALAGAALAPLGGGLLAAGGHRPAFGGLLGDRNLTSTFYYDPEADRWSARRVLFAPARGTDLVRLGNELVLPATEDYALIYHPARDRWTDTWAFDAPPGSPLVALGAALYRIDRDAEGIPHSVLLARALHLFEPHAD